MSAALETGFELDRRWHWLRAEMETTKKPDLLRLGQVLAAAACPYAIIGGIALQIHQEEPRTTLDIDLALLDRNDLPREDLLRAGFSETGRFQHSDNWLGPDGTPVQFTDDPALAAAIGRAQQIGLEGVSLAVLRRGDLLHEKLRAAADPARRRSKRLQDLADAESLLETTPELAEELTPAERGLLGEITI
jgi:hypothetical protein